MISRFNFYFTYRTFLELISITIVLFTLSNIISFPTFAADEYFFNFIVSNNVVSLNGEIGVTFVFELEGYAVNDFLVRPQVDNGIVSIYDPLTKIWKNGKSGWSEMPNLEKEMRIKVSDIPVVKTKLNFEILNTLDGEVFNTPSKLILSRSLVEDYVESFNALLLGMAGSSPASNLVNDLIESGETTASELDLSNQSVGKATKQEGSNKSFVEIAKGGYLDRLLISIPKKLIVSATSVVISVCLLVWTIYKSKNDKIL